MRTRDGTKAWPSPRSERPAITSAIWIDWSSRWVPAAPGSIASLLKKLEQLEPESELSHYKAIALALRGNESPAAGEVLANLLDRPGFVGHATVDPVARRQDASGQEVVTVADRFVTTAKDEQANDANLNRAFKELIVAAMLYRCGDRNGQAETI